MITTPDASPADITPEGARWLDRAGMLASVTCAVHCVGTALFMASLAGLGLSGLADPRVEQLFITASVALGGISLLIGHRRHRSVAPALWLGAGLCLLLLVRPQLTAYVAAESVVVVLGAGSVVRAHWLNQRRARHTAGRAEFSAAE